MGHRIRQSFIQKRETLVSRLSVSSSCTDSLLSKIEVDETYVGGKEKNKHAHKKIAHAQGRSTLGKTPVVGIIKRGFPKEIRAFQVENTNQKTIKKIV